MQEVLSLNEAMISAIPSLGQEVLGFASARSIPCPHSWSKIAGKLTGVATTTAGGGESDASCRSAGGAVSGKTSPAYRARLLANMTSQDLQPGILGTAAMQAVRSSAMSRQNHCGTNDTTGQLVAISTLGAITNVIAYPAGMVDIDGLAVGNGIAYLVTDEAGAFPVYDNAGGPFGAALTSPFTAADTFSGAAFAGVGAIFDDGF